jgi:hypothetical protein
MKNSAVYQEVMGTLVVRTHKEERKINVYAPSLLAKGTCIHPNSTRERSAAQDRKEALKRALKERFEDSTEKVFRFDTLHSMERSRLEMLLLPADTRGKMSAGDGY